MLTYVQVEALLTKLPAMFARTVNGDSCLFSAVQAASSLMQHIGG
jgi:hypothetical protein